LEKPQKGEYIFFAVSIFVRNASENNKITSSKNSSSCFDKYKAEFFNLRIIKWATLVALAETTTTAERSQCSLL
jgi:hypothetical protein